jgi:hypothetical protein
LRVTNVTRKNLTQPRQPLSAGAYALIALVGLAFGVGMLLFYFYSVPRLVASGIQNQVFYLLLIPWALVCAAFLFGAMRSYARYKGKHPGRALELGGPVVLFCLVMVGGFKLVPAPPATFDLTVRPHGAHGAAPVITSGEITIDLDNDRRSKSINANGEADFKGVPAKFKGATVGVLPQVEGYQEEWQHLHVKGDVLEVTLQPAPPPVTSLTGSIIPPPGNWASLRLVVDGQRGEGKVDGLGRFALQVKGKEGDTIRLKIYDGTKLVFDDFETLPGPLTLSLIGR